MQEDQLQEGRGNNLFTVKNFIILLIGFVLGYFVKMQAGQTITIGYDDYKLSQWQSNIEGVGKEEIKSEEGGDVIQNNEESNEDMSTDNNK